MKDEGFNDNLKEMPSRRKWRAWLGAMLVVFFLVWAGMVFLLPADQRGGKNNQIMCASRLKNIGVAISNYAQDHHEEFPNSFQELVETGYIPASAFICPAMEDTPAAGATTQAIVDHLMDGGHMSYIYVGRGLKNGSVPDDVVIAYEPLSNHAGQGMNVLFGDGHVEFLDPTQAAKIIVLAESTRRPVVLGTNP